MGQELGIYVKFYVNLISKYPIFYVNIMSIKIIKLLQKGSLAPIITRR